MKQFKKITLYVSDLYIKYLKLEFSFLPKTGVSPIEILTYTILKAFDTNEEYRLKYIKESWKDF